MSKIAKIYFIIFIIGFNLTIISQISSYFSNNCVDLFHINERDSVFITFASYNFYFFGERHDTYGLGAVQAKCLDLLKSNKSIVFTEYPVTYTELYNKYLYLENVDTNQYKFTFLSNSKEYNQLSRKIYFLNNNTPINERIRFIPIDIPSIKNIEPNDILQYYEFKKNRNLVQVDLDIIESIKKRTAKKTKIKLYKKFHNRLLDNRDLHMSYLGAENYSKIANSLLGLDIYVNNSDKVRWYQSKERENYMYNNIKYVIEKSKDLNFICFTGHFHIPLDIPKEWVSIKNWESLAYKIKDAYPQKKVCSIYYMNRKNDYLSDIYFPTEKKIILENTKLGETYLIRLDGENTPFKELSQKFQYIVVW